MWMMDGWTDRQWSRLYYKFTYGPKGLGELIMLSTTVVTGTLRVNCDLICFNIN